MKKIVLFVLDGAADRVLPELDGKTPLQAASTARLDRLAVNSALGCLLPRPDFKGASTDLTHFSFLGYEPESYPGRSVLEALASGIKPRPGRIYFSALLCASYAKDGKTYLVRENVAFLEGETKRLFQEIDHFYSGFYSFRLFFQKGRYGILEVKGPFVCGATDTDPFKDDYPAGRPLPASSSFRDACLAEALETYLNWARARLQGSAVNKERKEKGLPALDLLVTKWPSFLKTSLPSFFELTGMKGAIVASQSFFKGMASLLGMEFVQLEAGYTADKVGQALMAAEELLFKSGFDFVLLNIKDIDEASHKKDPYLKVKVIEAVDEGLEKLEISRLLDKQKVVLAITADHPTPSTGNLIHSGEPTPLLVHADYLAPDSTSAFNEVEARKGLLPQLGAENLLAFLMNAADRIGYSGSLMSSKKRLGFYSPDEIRHIQF